VTEQEVEAAATAIANRRGLYHGVPQIANVLEMLARANRGRLVLELLSDGRAALEAAERIRTEESNREAAGGCLSA
jgi:hypothetical protein